MKVIAIINDDESVSWCYCYDGSNRELMKTLKTHYTDPNEVRSLVSHDIDWVKSIGYNKTIDLKSQKPFSSLKALFKGVKDDADYVFVFDEYENWKFKSLKKR